MIGRAWTRRGREAGMHGPQGPSPAALAAEAQLCVAAERGTPEEINFMAAHGRGLVCLSLTEERMRKLGIPFMVPEGAGLRRPFGASIEARRGVTTGISAHDRATTIRAA